MKDIETLTEEIRVYAKTVLKKKRFEHSVRVAETASKLCKRFGIDKKKGYLSGIAHDICKDMEPSSLSSFALRDGKGITEAEKEKPSLMHGRAAAVLLREKFGVVDNDVIQAVACHTLGGVGLSPLARIIYVADKIEPCRPQSTEEYRDRLFSMTISSMTLAVLEENMRYLKAKGAMIAEQSLDFRSELKKEIKSAKA